MTDLRKLAEAATKGPWVEDDGNVHSEPLGMARETAILAKIDGRPFNEADIERIGCVTSCNWENPNSDADAAFIAAASPDVVLGLLERIEKLRTELLGHVTYCIWNQANVATPPEQVEWTCSLCKRTRIGDSDAPDDHEVTCLLRREP